MLIEDDDVAKLEGMERVAMRHVRVCGSANEWESANEWLAIVRCWLSEARQLRAGIVN